MSSLQDTTTPMIPLNPNNTTEEAVVSISSTKQQLELHTTTGMEGSGSDNNTDTKERNVTAFYNVVWPILEKEGGWTLVRVNILLFY